MAFRLTLDGVVHEIEIVSRRPRLTVRIDGRLREVTGDVVPGDGRHAILVDGTEHATTRARTADTQHVRFGGRSFDVALVDPRAEAGAGGGSHDHIKAPMPGAVVSVQKQAGEAVMRGETVLTIESMKLQTALASPRDGVVGAILKGEGETFEKDEIVARLEPVEG
jgi:biotin carboxyl carrier protein